MSRPAARLLALPCGTVALLLPALAPAQETSGFGRGDDVVVTVDNLAGVVHERVSNDDSSMSITHIGSIATMPTIGIPARTRLGLHYFVASAVSVGAGLHYSDSDELGEALVFAPRVGFTLPSGASHALWLRAGVTYARHELSSLGETTFTHIMPAADALFVYSPVEHFAFTLGATAEIGVYGKRKTDLSRPGYPGPAIDSESDYKCTSFGAVFGALVSF